MASKRSFWARAWPALLRSPLIRPGDSVLAGVSGGPDSVALAHALRLLSRKKGLRVALAHVHHGMRGREADRDAEWVRRLGHRLGLPTYLRRVDVPGTARRQRRSPEDAARRLRYRALAGIARREGFGKVAVAHHADDQAETVLLHLLRGTDPRGLSGMPARRRLAKGVELVRPLLAWTRREVRTYLAIHGLGWRSDRTNADPRLTRNWVRLKLLPLLESKAPRLRERLVRLAAGAARAFAGRPTRRAA